MAHKSDQEMIAKTRNTARFFTENKHVSWVLLVFTILWGVYGYLTMPKRKDPEIPVRVAAAIMTWPGATAENVEDRVTRVVERKLAENSKIEKIESTTRAGVAVVTFMLDKNVNDTGKEFDDIWLKLSAMKDLPDGAAMKFLKDFGDTAALMLTVASPRATDVEVQLRAEKIAEAIKETRSHAREHGPRASLVGCFPYSLDDRDLGVVSKDLAAWAESRGATDVRIFSGPGFLGIDSHTQASDEKILANAREFVLERLRASEIHPDVWPLAVIRDPADTEAKLAVIAGEKYSYRDLDIYSEQIEKALQGVPAVARVSRSGVVGDVIYLDYSQEKLASYGIGPGQIKEVLAARNINARGGAVEVQGKSILIAPDGELHGEDEIGGIVVTKSASGAPVYVRDLVTISRAYETPQYVSYSTWKDAAGNWQRTRAITLALTMKSGLQIAAFGEEVEKKIAEVRALLPEDLILESVSDQPQQVEENVDLFMSSLYEAIVLVVLVALVGFWEWRSALLMALSIPITLAMTFGMMRLVGMDVQQISIGSLIIALGLLVDDPVVAGDAIKRDLGKGLPGRIAAWLGPTKLATAILFATITNIVAYLPFLTLTGDTGRFIFSLPVVLTASLVASRLVSMSFVPVLGMVLLRRGKPEPSMEERRSTGFARLYTSLVTGAVRHRWAVLVGAVAMLALGVVAARGVKQNFFPKDYNYLAYVDVWLPEDSPVTSTHQTAAEVESIVREVAGPHGLQSVTTFVGGGGPRFWFSIGPEQQQANYAQVLIRLNDKHQTAHVVGPLQDALSARVAGARIDVREIESGPGVGVPVSIRVAGEDPNTLRAISGKIEDVIRRQPNAERVRDTWGSDNFTVKLEVDPDRSSAAGVTNADVATASNALNGARVGALQEGDHQLPIVTRLRASERQHLSDVGNLYVYASHDPGTKVPLRQISELDFGGATAKILRRNHVRTITVGGFPTQGALSSEVLAQITPEVEKIKSELPPGYTIEIGGEQEEQQKSFKELAIVLLISVASIFVALVLQFRNAAKPLIVFVAIPFGIVASLLSLRLMGSAFGFMAFLGMISLIGVIVSHVIVLFDFIEEKHEAGAPLLEALVDAGILRLRPVLVTVGATVLGLVPLAIHGGSLWEPLCYVQIGGLTFATVVTLVLVPVFYAVFVLDLKLVTWDAHEPHAEVEPAPSSFTPSLTPAE
jgi:multidrug efflux pump subunit AcrB